jgi:GTPase
MWANPRCSTVWSGRKLALVDDQPGVTRDLREGDAKLFDLRFTVIDTAGLEEVTDDSLQGRMRRLTERAVEMADVCLFLIDGRVGVTPTDEVFADILRKKSARVVLGVNKAEGAAGDSGALEAWSWVWASRCACRPSMARGWMTFTASCCPSARNSPSARRRTRPRPRSISPKRGDEEVDPIAHRPTAKKPLQIAVIGRPNAGKSTLINKIIGEDRLLTGPRGGDHARCDLGPRRLAGHADPDL